MRLTTTFLTLTLSSALTVASAQNGSDNCATPDPIAGQGSFAFDNSLANTGIEGQNEYVCYAFGSSSVNDDVWFSWTADATGSATISTCNASFDTKIAAYPGGPCPTVGSSLACNDDSCGLQSSISFPVVSGTAYLLQVGTFAVGGGGTSTIDVVIGGGGGGGVGSDNCATPTAIAGQGSFAYDNSTATTGVEGQTEGLCYAFGTSGIDNDIWFAWTADATGPATVSTCSSSQDTKIAAYPAGGCPTAGSSLACNDDTCGLQSEIVFNAVVGTTYLLQVGNFPGGVSGASLLDISIAGPVEPGTAYCFCDVGNAPCANNGAPGNGCANGSDVNGANLTGSGSASLIADSLILSASGLAPGQPGLYFQGDTQISGGAGVVFGDGIRCAGTNVVRLGVVNSDASGASSTAALGSPISALGGVNPGETKSYQLWYRDPIGTQCGASFNLTNGYTITW